MGFSRPTLTAALFSCIVHLCALGLLATIILTHAEHTSVPLKVTLLQPAVPLPVGEKEARSTNEPEPAAQLTPPPPPPPPVKVEPKVKKLSVKPTHPISIPVKKPPPPPVVTAPPPPEPVPQPAALALPVNDAPATDGSNSEDAVGTTRPTSTDVAGSPGEMGAGHHNEAGHRGSPGGTSTRPDYGENPKPPYPLIARRMGTQGTVLLHVHVRADGSVAEAEVQQSSGSPVLDASALRTVRESWRFVPARRDGVPVESWVEVPIRFVLKES